jgi:ribosomal protein L37AE/L43A
VKPRAKRQDRRAVSGPNRIVCPLCELGEMDILGQSQARCSRCDATLSGSFLGELQTIAALPDALGAHACEECGHPEMRLLPDGTFHCPACGSEVLSLDLPPVGS